MSSSRKILILVAVIAVVLLGNYFFPQFARWSWLLLVLACPISMILFMDGMHDRHNHSEKTQKTERVFACPECGLVYKDAEWAKKCAAWCKEHKSCNLEITKHAIT